jgi:protein phosphatase
MLDRLKGLTRSLSGDEPEEEILPTFDLPTPPAATPIEAVPAIPVEPLPEPILEGVPVASDTEPTRCPVCNSARVPGCASCADCGFHFPGATSRSTRNTPVTAVRIKQRYELGELLGERGNVSRFRCRDLGLSGSDNVPVILVRQPSVPQAAPAETPAEPADEDILPAFDRPSAPITDVLPLQPAWPSVGWERNLLDILEHPGLPVILDVFTEGGFDYVIEELPVGRQLWDAWDDPEATYADRFGWLAQVAEAMQALHGASAMLEAIRPDMVVVNDQGRARITDLSDLLPMPLPADPPLRAGLYTAPELLSAPEMADPRANLYSFGAMLYALHVGRELSEREFLSPGNPKPVFNDYPDLHPAIGRLLLKTFNRQVESRFPTDEAVKDDLTGFRELIRTLGVCARTVDNVRLEISAWTTIGMVRTGNEDAFALLQSCESRQDDVAESALLLLADGMGGYEAGEVAATLAIQTLRENLTSQPQFAALGGGKGFVSELPNPDGNPLVQTEVEEIKRLLRTALKDANKQVFTASRSGIGRRGMGCTAEVVYVNGRHAVVGHVGDSRTYHLSEGRFLQVTRDQTLVNRLVELGTLTEEEAETHPRRNELQQAVGGQPDVEPGIYHAVLKAGDYLIICSDGLSNHVKNLQFRQFLQGDDAVSAERAARRLVNLANIEGATDNATVIVVRAT